MKLTGPEKVVRNLLASAGIKVGGKNPWDIQIKDRRAYDKILGQGSLGFGESYMDNWWDCDALDDLICRIHEANLREKAKKDMETIALAVRSRLFNLQTNRRAFEVAEKHYDLGNDLYEPMLGKTMAYTCAYWRNASNLDEAQTAKFDLICRKTGLKPGMKILELGCGWGSFAKHAAENYGVEITGYTVSKEQVALGMERCKGLPVVLRLDDYRHARGEYDAIISIGIMEHVGYKNYRTYMKVADRCLKKNGVVFIHTIGGNKSRTAIEPWLNKYIFPNAMLPSIAQLATAMEGLFIIEDLHNIGPDYDRTLLAWHENFEKAWPALKEKYSERFYRMWRFYLLSCAAVFRARYAQLWQMVLTRIGTPQPDCRIS
ncbi:MAG: cyclopropane fatty acyl phospholipid synthase [Lentisphaerae bacterium]|nr:cyclopropane fatty acyl phospholipid synthase [Lentisphaerota bacterium]